MLVAGGALVRVNDAARGEGVIVAQQHRGYDPSTAVPIVILRNDDYGRVERLIADGLDVKLDFDIVNHLYPEGKTSYNTIGEIPGTDKADQVVMLGGHLDSWQREAIAAAPDQESSNPVIASFSRRLGDHR